MTDNLIHFAPPETAVNAAERETRAEDVGSLVVCLDYLAREATRGSMASAARHIDAAMYRILQEAYSGENGDISPARLESVLLNAAGFVDALSGITDPDIRDSLIKRLEACEKED